MTPEELKTKLMSLDSAKNSYCHNMISSLYEKTGSEKGDLTFEELKNSSMIKSWTKSKNTAASDPLAGIVELLSTIIEAPAPAAIGRPMVTVTETVQESVKLRLPKLAVASSTSSSKKGKSVGERNLFLTLTPDKEIEDSEEYDDNYLENSPWNVTQRQVQAISAGHDLKETLKIIEFYNTLPNASLATGAVQTPATTGSFTFTDMVDLWTSLGDFDGTIMVMNKKTYGKIVKEQDFKDQTIFGSAVDVKTGNMGSSILGFEILVSTLVPDDIVFAIAVASAGQYVLRRNKVLKTFQSSINSEQVQISSRYDLKLARIGSVAKMDISL